MIYVVYERTRYNPIENNTNVLLGRKVVFIFISRDDLVAYLLLSLPGGTCYILSPKYFITVFTRLSTKHYSLAVFNSGFRLDYNYTREKSCSSESYAQHKIL